MNKRSPAGPSPASDATPAVARIGRFYITRELGRGSIGTVYLAHDPIIDRDVALKTFNARMTLADKKQHEQQLINEARAAGRLSHPSIVTIFEASSEGGTTYIAMEYLQGKELARMLDKKHSFTPDEIATIIWKVADALDYAHKNNVIHRDIKPANIFITGNNHPTLVDFGIARSPNRVSDKEMHKDQAYTLFQNNLLGTPNYMSPEQATGRAVDSRTDIYSLGAVMYEMLAGRKPFQLDGDQLLQAIAHKAPSSPIDLNPKAPLALSRIAMMALSKRPEKRYQTGQEMALDLKRYLSQERKARRNAKQTMADAEESPGSRNDEIDRSRLILVACAAVIGVLVVVYSIWLR
jgi:serine/threonine-protein kinase